MEINEVKVVSSPVFKAISSHCSVTGFKWPNGEQEEEEMVENAETEWQI